MQQLCLPESVPADVEVWRIALADGAAPVSTHGLSHDEVLRMGRFRQVDDARRFADTRRTLRALLARRLDVDAQALVFTRGLHGKPALAAAQRGAWEFSVSHAGQAALVALSNQRAVGVDIEWGRPCLDVQAMGPLCLTEDERERVAHAPDAAGFYRHWVGKEAVLKALGLGIGLHMQQLSVTPADCGEYRLRHCLPGVDAEGAVCACALPAPAGYLAALAWLDDQGGSASPRRPA
ncbi:4'-phosphopantetheinyl transferase superfamily protein [Achromobacter sp. MFA1 R4]|uniref:4'-phosphopantetheinyl transferase family protein n=1 Tax=Achromobacter sp. MFA1 R4 TaxID=1881016 RepID=UPI0009538C9E|nr:4'-phosphopantetheinyl transferase superfamily protein [Achromobacter sp. MFA1 R4]SIT01245.1 4'-phosphopantetheinyl transferase [Achromobacter sp. MFA1 R4]